MKISDREARRRFLRFLLASPLIAAGSRLSFAQQQAIIASPEEALDVFDFEAAARSRLPPAHFGYMATGVDDDATLRANREGFGRYQLRVRRLVDVRSVDMSVALFGRTWETPIVLAPVGSQRAFHPEGEVAVARAAKAKKHLQILSTVTSTPLEEVVSARGEPPWYQLYPTDQWPVTRGLIKRAEAAGCTTLVLTVDLQGGSNRVTLSRMARTDTRQCTNCHQGGPFTATNVYAARKPMFSGLDTSAITTLEPFGMNWDFVKHVRDETKMKLLIKGIVTREDAELSVEHGVDGVIVSNHGGRAEESGRGTIECLSEVVDGARGRIPVLVDGGFRRGTDVFKALALGAQAVCVGRPYVWGLGAFGQPGVEAVLTILRTELQTIMRQAGAVRVANINRSMVIAK